MANMNQDCEKIIEGEEEGPFESEDERNAQQFSPCLEKLAAQYILSLSIHKLNHRLSHSDLRRFVLIRNTVRNIIDDAMNMNQ